MGILTNDMKRVVEQQRLGFVATVCPDGTPNLSPKGTTAVWGDIISSSPTSDRPALSRTCEGTSTWK
jgi:predicted pyridoxine 5'-phosphate oxidase superfamily flavin-nucleotide-binding protein